MVATQNETLSKAERGNRKTDVLQRRSSLRPQPSAFTLTELLVVITIIAILSALLFGAVQSAIRNAKQAEIILELQNMAGEMENLSNDLGAYPPNGMNGMNGNIRALNTIAQTDIERMFKKAFPRHKEPIELIRALAAAPPSQVSFSPGNAQVQLPTNDSGDTGGGLTGAEAIVFWLGGFSDDSSYPISGPGGPSFADGPDSGSDLNASDEVLEDRNLRYEFDLAKLGPKTDDGQFNQSVGRYIEYLDPRPGANGVRRRINLWTYKPGASEIPAYYFDTSRHDPEDYDVDMTGLAQQGIFALKQLRTGVSVAQSNSDIRWVEDSKFQILHPGVDDIWGDAFASCRLNVEANGDNAFRNVLLAPEGPFIGDIADTLGNFMTGTLEDKE